mmetsp:Transcript_21971/g.68190  ORF Transcript_21971/g.68190 Transcript_21971/m.68190 type:complete len:208 (+) Transcript_21971:701-1324(+)
MFHRVVRPASASGLIITACCAVSARSTISLISRTRRRSAGVRIRFAGSGSSMSTRRSRHISGSASASDHAGGIAASGSSSCVAGAAGEGSSALPNPSMVMIGGPSLDTPERPRGSVLTEMRRGGAVFRQPGADAVSILSPAVSSKTVSDFSDGDNSSLPAGLLLRRLIVSFAKSARWKLLSALKLWMFAANAWCDETSNGTRPCSRQ